MVTLTVIVTIPIGSAHRFVHLRIYFDEVAYLCVSVCVFCRSQACEPQTSARGSVCFQRHQSTPASPGGSSSRLARCSTRSWQTDGQAGHDCKDSEKTNVRSTKSTCTQCRQFVARSTTAAATTTRLTHRYIRHVILLTLSMCPRGHAHIYLTSHCVHIV